MKTKIQKTLALLLMLTTVLSVVTFGAFAAEADDAVINSDATGSITVTKYATENTSRPSNSGTGLNGQTVPENSGYTPLNGAAFKLFRIADAAAVMDYYNGTSDTQYLLERFNYDRDTKTATYKYDGTNETTLTVLASGTTAGSGTYTFSGLAVGIYALVEDTAPDQITVPLAENSLISIPMVNTATSSNNDNAKWMYDVFVYPKNHEATGTVELLKQDQNGAALQNVVFKLYKKEFLSNGELTTEDWQEVTYTSPDDDATTQNLTLTTGADGKIVLENLPANLYGTQYKLVEVYEDGTSPEGYIINSNPLYFKVNNDNTMSWNAASGEKGDCNNANTGVLGTPTPTADPKLSMTLRNEQPSLTKQVQENGGSSWKQDEQYRLDDTITYRLIAYVPNNVTEITYEIKDLPQVGITDSAESTDYTVTYGDTSDSCTAPLTGDCYSWSKIDATGTNGQGFQLTLDDGTAAGKFIQIVYKAHMNANAVIAGTGNGNTATLTYSKYIGSTDATTYAITDEARVYTYQFQITKYKDSASTGNEVGNVEFKLLDSTNPENILKVVQLEAGEYRLAIGTDAASATTDTLITKADGTILIQGLENGAYYLKETKTVDGYNLLSAPFKIELDVTETTAWSEDGQFTASGKVVKTYGTGEHTTYSLPDAKGTSTIINKKGFVLPQTGSMGYLLFCAVGIVLIAGGTVLIFGGRKKKIR